MHSKLRQAQDRWNGRCRLAIASAALVLTAAGQAATLVAPNDLETSDSAFGAGTLAAANYRSQQVYGAQHFPPDIALVITELRFRPDYSYGSAFNTTIGNIQIRLSTTQSSPDGLSPIYASNVGPDETVVFNGSLNMSSQFTGPANGPKAFDMVIPLTTPFLYNPAAGHLLLEIRNTSGSGASPMSGRAVPGDGASRVGGTLGSGTGGADSGVDALQIVYTPTNQPPVPPQPTLLTRGPYLQKSTVSNIVVRWRTSLATNSVAQFGLSPAALNWAVTNSTRTNRHSVTLTNLAPDTKYYYAVGAGETNLAGGPDCFFITPPATQRPTRIWVIGDFGTASQPFFGIVNDPEGMRDSYYTYTSNRYTDVWLLLGDNAYNSGTDEEYQTNLFGVFPDMLRQTAAWSTIGNHDASTPTAYHEIFDLPTGGEAGGVASGSELYYSFNHGNIHFVCLDSELSANTAGSAMLTWLEADLAANTNDWLIAFWHSPPYTFSSHDSDNPFDTGGHLVQMRQNVVPILEGYGVDLVLCGHSHAYERSYLIDGHYGYSSSFVPTMALDSGSGREGDSGAYRKAGTGPVEHQGAVYAVCGSSGWVTGPIVSLEEYLHHPTTFLGLEKVGSMVLDVSSNRLDAKFVSHTGDIDDELTILKGAAAEPLRIKTFKLAGGSVSMQFKTQAGARYLVERATHLGPSDWAPAGAEIIATGATTKWSGPAPTGPAFYRVTKVQPAP